MNAKQLFRATMSDVRCTQRAAKLQIAVIESEGRILVAGCLMQASRMLYGMGFKFQGGRWEMTIEEASQRGLSPFKVRRQVVERICKTTGPVNG